MCIRHIHREKERDRDIDRENICHYVTVSAETKRGCQILWAEVTGGCEQLDMSARNQAQVLWRSGSVLNPEPPLYPPISLYAHSLIQSSYHH